MYEQQQPTHGELTMWDNYELRSHPRGWAIVHITSGYVTEVLRSRAKAEAMLSRYNEGI
jgi:ribosomal protein S10